MNNTRYASHALQEGREGMAVTQTGNDHRHKKDFLHRFSERGKRNSRTTRRVVYATGRIRGLLTTMKLVKGRKRRERLFRQNSRDGEKAERGMTTCSPFMLPLLSFPDLIFTHLHKYK